MKLLAIQAVAMATALATGAFAQSPAPAGYPADYAAIVEAAKSEPGVLVYGNLPEESWTPIIKAFNEKYPGIKVQALDLGGDLWERYYVERAAGTRTADMILTGSIDRWLEFVDRGEVMDYTSAEDAALPDWSKPFPGLYTASTDPLIMVYNKFAIPGDKPPESVADVVSLVEQHPAELQGRVTTYDAGVNPFGLAIYWTWLRDSAQKWEPLDKIGPFTRPERSAGTMREKIFTGEYAVSLFFSGASIPQLNAPGAKEVASYSLIKDGTPVMMRGVGLTKGAGSPNSAKLLLDFILSKDGQIALSAGGPTPYREDISKDEVPYNTLQSIRDEIGAENVFMITYDRDIIGQREEFVKRWTQAFRNHQ